MPFGIQLVLRLLAAGDVTIERLEQATAPVKAATLADPDLTTAEKVCALTPKVCRWPCGDPGRPDFQFCGNPVVSMPYCKNHRTMAYQAPRYQHSRR
jgi:GcrA cell cycle regulator